MSLRTDQSSDRVLGALKRLTAGGDTASVSAQQLVNDSGLTYQSVLRAISALQGSGQIVECDALTTGTQRGRIAKRWTLAPQACASIESEPMISGQDAEKSDFGPLRAISARLNATVEWVRSLRSKVTTDQLSEEFAKTLAIMDLTEGQRLLETACNLRKAPKTSSSLRDDDLFGTKELNAPSQQPIRDVSRWQK